MPNFGSFFQDVCTYLRTKYCWSAAYLFGLFEFEEKGRDVLDILFKYHLENISAEDTADKVNKFLKGQ